MCPHILPTWITLIEANTNCPNFSHSIKLYPSGAVLTKKSN